jgi:hypothetical protein
MSQTYWLSIIAATAVFASATATAQPQQKHPGGHHRANPVLQTVPNSSQPSDAAYGWQYFSDPHAARAVIISPSGEYFLSKGKGLRQITGASAQVSLAQPA